MKIPIFTFLSLLGINTLRILTEQSRPTILRNDPSCGLTAGGRDDCTWDCQTIISSNSIPIYQDPICLRDCDHFPSCFHMLMEDYVNNEGICSGSFGQNLGWNVSPNPCTVTSGQIEEGLCRQDTEIALGKSRCSNNLRSSPISMQINIFFLIRQGFI